MRVMERPAKPTTAKGVHDAVEEHVGQRVPYSSVKNWLAKEAMSGRPRVVRLARGRYALATEIAAAARKARAGSGGQRGG